MQFLSKKVTIEKGQFIDGDGGLTSMKLMEVMVEAESDELCERYVNQMV